jgi:hypothetical protein
VRVDFTRLRVIENKTICVESTRVRVESTLMRVVKKNNNNNRLVPVDLSFMCIIMSLK